MQLALTNKAPLSLCVCVSASLNVVKEDGETERKRHPRLLKGVFELALFPEAAKWRQSSVYLTASSLTHPPPPTPLPPPLSSLSLSLSPPPPKNDRMKVLPSPF